MSSLQPYFDLSSLLEYILKMLASGVTAFVTDENKGGLAVGAQAGDEIVIWEGCPRPAITRRVQEQESNNIHCLFVSEAYYFDINVRKELRAGDLTTTFIVH